MELIITLLADVEWMGYDITGENLQQERGIPLPEEWARGGSVRHHLDMGLREVRHFAEKGQLDSLVSL